MEDVDVRPIDVISYNVTYAEARRSFLSAIGMLMKEKRLQNGLTITHAAQSVGICEKTLMRYENGQTDMRLSCVVGLLRLYNVTVDELNEILELENDEKLPYMDYVLSGAGV